MITNCDMCGSQIKDGECNCGEWIEKEVMGFCPINQGIEKFHEIKKFTLIGDAPHLGCAVVYFRGDYNDCHKVQKFIYEMKGRPYYD